MESLLLSIGIHPLRPPAREPQVHALVDVPTLGHELRQEEWCGWQGRDRDPAAGTAHSVDAIQGPRKEFGSAALAKRIHSTAATVGRWFGAAGESREATQQRSVQERLELILYRSAREECH